MRTVKNRMEAVIERDAKGRFMPGSHVNPGGRPKGNPAVKELLKQHSVDAAEKVVELLNCGNPKIELAAAQEILNRRTEGKPLQVQDVQMELQGTADIGTQIRELLLEHDKRNAEAFDAGFEAGYAGVAGTD